MAEEEKYLESFFDEILDDETEKLIVKLVGQDLEADKILDQLIAKATDVKK